MPKNESKENVFFVRLFQSALLSCVSNAVDLSY